MPTFTSKEYFSHSPETAGNVFRRPNNKYAAFNRSAMADDGSVAACAFSPRDGRLHNNECTDFLAVLFTRGERKIGVQDEMDAGRWVWHELHDKFWSLRRFEDFRA